MGLSKVVNKGNGKIIIVHQLDSLGRAYAEDVTIEVQAGVSPDRLSYLASLNGQIGVISYSFSAYTAVPEGILFPEV